MLPLLKTKIRVPPPRREAVDRPRLISRLEDGLGCRLILVSAPPGFGKSLLLSQWASNCSMPVAWVSLDENDNDPVLFWSYFIAALQSLKPEMGRGVLACLQSPQPPPMEGLLAGLVNDIEELGPFAMVVDDYHAISTPQIHQGIAYLIEHLPGQMHLVISGRMDPPLPLARLRARNHLLEIRAADLSFTPAEAARFFKDVIDLEMPAKEIMALLDRTEGWAASLQLAAISLKDRQDRSHLIAGFSGSHRYVLDYLTDEVLNGLSYEVKNFLLQTSVLRRLCGPLCNAVTMKDNGREMLARLEASNLFVEPLDDERRWYRYHNLFADLLRAQLAAGFREVEPLLHQRASLWFESESLIDEAIYHSLAAGDFARAAGLIERIAENLVSQSQIATLLKYAGTLPPEILDTRPWLTVCYAWARLLAGQLDKVTPLLAGLGPYLASAPATEEATRVRGHALTIQGYAASFQGRVAEALRISEQAARLLPETDMIARSANALNRGIAAFMSGQLKEASAYLKEAGETSRKANNLYVGVEAMSSLADLQAAAGHLREAMRTYEEAIQLGQRWACGQNPPAAAHAYHGLAQLYYEWNNLDEAIRHVQTGIELSETAHLPAASDYATLARIRQASGDTTAALEAISKAETGARALDSLAVSSSQARLLLALGDRQKLAAWTKLEAPQIKSLNVDFQSEAPYLTLTLVNLALERPDEPAGIVLKALERAEGQGRTRSVIEILAVQALILAKRGRADEAIEALNRALSLAETEGYVRTFVDQGPAMQQLLRQAIKTSPAKDYIHRLLTAFPAPTPQDSTLAVKTETGFVEHFNEREKAILRLIADGKSNGEIASQLFLSLNTVKWYIRHLYSKLGATDRLSAVQRAKALHIL